MNVLLDVNVVLDILFAREPWVHSARTIWDANHTGRIRGFVVATAVTNVFYIANELQGMDVARRCVRECLEAFAVVPVDSGILKGAFALAGDFEDNVAIRCAAGAELDWIVTRDARGYLNSSIPAVSPEELCFKGSQSSAG